MERGGCEPLDSHPPRNPYFSVAQPSGVSSAGGTIESTTVVSMGMSIISSGAGAAAGSTWVSMISASSWAEQATAARIATAKAMRFILSPDGVGGAGHFGTGVGLSPDRGRSVLKLRARDPLSSGRFTLSVAQVTNHWTDHAVKRRALLSSEQVPDAEERTVRTGAAGVCIRRKGRARPHWPTDGR